MTHVWTNEGGKAVIWTVGYICYNDDDEINVHEAKTIGMMMMIKMMMMMMQSLSDVKIMMG